MIGYDTADYAATRLVDTIIRYKDMAVFVKAVGLKNGKISIRCLDLLDEDENLIEAYLEDCDINPVPLGYVNHNKTTHYITRTPMRRDWRQGLRMLNIVDVEGAQPRMIPYHTIAHTILGKYPSFKSCLDRLSSKDKILKMAYCRDFSINNEGVLIYKGLFEVGKIDMINGAITILPEYNWVGEAFDESMEKV